MHRISLLKKLISYQKEYPEEKNTVSSMVAFIKSNSKCFDRNLSIGHMTGSAWLMDAKFEKTLLTHHRKLDRWLQPGGHADGDSDIAGVALREAREESGLQELELVHGAIFDIDIHLIPDGPTEKAHLHYDCRFLIRSVGKDQYVVSEESKDLAWVYLKDLPKYTSDPSISRMALKSVTRKP